MPGFFGLWHYQAIIILMMMGFYTVIARDNLVKKMMGLSIFQVAAIMLYLTMGKVKGGTAPIIPEGGVEGVIFTNPIPSVLMLTSIVVGLATLSLGLSFVVRIQGAYGTVEEDELNVLDLQDSTGG